MMKIGNFKIPWGPIGVFLSLSFGALGFYLYLYQPSPSISAKIVSESSVLAVQRSVEDLEIFFQGENIQEENLNLRIYTIEFVNDSTVNILQHDYDQATTWGLQVNGAEARIVEEPRLISSNSDYIRNNLNPRVINHKTVSFSPIIFERKKLFILEVLVLHPSENPPALEVIGKIAGIENILIIKDEFSHNTSMIERFFSGGPLINILRIILYPLIVFAAGFCGYIIVEKIKKLIPYI